ncbi:mutator family transposase domain protein [Candidatus Erwinia dacicola]|uniref:Mutator family transposase domain protein n=1 Tax=Candidatus Erwinia dacicola TaxID=252393 RepID=A0A328TJV7_9GAMM|nr:mutator family transposase domain protein [Candidatus Erwinia dacicola]
MNGFTGSVASQADFIWKNAKDLWGDFKHTDFGKIMRNVLSCVSRASQSVVRAALQQVFVQTDKKSARAT